MTSHKEKKSEVTATHPRRTKRRTIRFFEEQLQGEEALTFATAEELFELAEEMYTLRPWQLMEDTDLVLVKDSETGEMCHCSLMGALGQVFALHAYRGAESYRLFRRMARGTPLTAGEFFAMQRSVSVEFLPSKELTGPDKELARAFGHPVSKGLAAPQFRAIRPGYHPWYVTENEGKVLGKCMDSVLEFYKCLVDEPNTQYWKDEDVYPEVVWHRRSHFGIIERLVPEPPAPRPEPAVLDEERLARFSKEDHPVRAVLEVNHIHTGIPIGKKEERKACLRTALVADATTRFLYGVEMAEPSESAGELLARVMMNTIERGNFVPAEVRVNSENIKLLLVPLGERVGFPVRIMKKLPAVDLAAKDLLRTMGDPGEIEV